MSGICYQNMAIARIAHAQVYNLITMKKTNCYCQKTCKSEINLNIIIFYKHIAILYVIMVSQHHTKVVEPHFPFLHLH